jgi:hypothetical protein
LTTEIETPSATTACIPATPTLAEEHISKPSLLDWILKSLASTGVPLPVLSLILILY